MQLLRRCPPPRGASSRPRIHRRRWALGLVLLSALSIGGASWAARRRHHHPKTAAPPPPPAEIDPTHGCKSNPAVVGRCFELQGRAFHAPGTPRLRIQPFRSRKALGVLPSDAEIIPVCLEDLLQPGIDVRGRFLVCPLSRPARRQMQMVCVEEASQLAASRWDPATQQFVPVNAPEACALEPPLD